MRQAGPASSGAIPPAGRPSSSAASDSDAIGAHALAQAIGGPPVPILAESGVQQPLDGRRLGLVQGHDLGQGIEHLVQGERGEGAPGRGPLIGIARQHN